MSRVTNSLRICLIAAMVSTVALSIRAADLEDDEAVAAREKAARDKLNEAKKKPADAKDAAADPFAALAEPAAKTPPSPFPPKKPTTVNDLSKVVDNGACAQCKGLGIIPNLPYRPYSKFDDPAPASDCVPWKYCDKCQKGADAKQIPADMKDRQQRAAEKHKTFEEQISKSLHLIETPFFSVHSQLDPAKNKSITAALEKCAGILQNNSHSMVLMTPRVDTDDILIIADQPTFAAYIDKTEPPSSLREVVKKGAGVHGPHLHVFRATPNLPPEGLAVFGGGSIIMTSATDRKAKPWLIEGFSAYCEHATMGTNTVITIAYDANDVKLGRNWNEDMKKAVKEGEAQTLG